MRLTLLRRPGLKRGRVPGHGREIAIVQPIQHGFFLGQPRELDVFSLARRELGAGGGGEEAVLLDEAGADEEDVADVHVAALGGGAEVDVLVEGAGG
jgi:hypothetical protein